jgi:hypothetical protein
MPNLQHTFLLQLAVHESCVWVDNQRLRQPSNARELVSKRQSACLDSMPDRIKQKE